MKRLRDYTEFASSYFSTRLMYLLSPIKTGTHVKFRGIPQVLMSSNASISIGDNTTINSSNYGYHINMFSRCKLYADKDGAAILIGRNCRIHGTCIHAYKQITIGNNCLIAANCQIIDANGHELSFDNPENRINTRDQGKEIVVEDNVWIGAGSIILGGANIGMGAVITAGSIVRDKVPPRCIYGGNPAKIIRDYNDVSREDFIS